MNAAFDVGGVVVVAAVLELELELGASAAAEGNEGERYAREGEDRGSGHGGLVSCRVCGDGQRVANIATHRLSVLLKTPPAAETFRRKRADASRSRPPEPAVA